MENKNKTNYFGATPTRPYHLSVGAVLIDAEGKVVCLVYPELDGLKDVYVLACKVPQPNETIEAALARGMAKELGSTGEILTFLGSQEIDDVWNMEKLCAIKKTTLFFLCRAISTDENIANEEIAKEGKQVTHVDIDFLINKMENQLLKDGMRDFNQSEILKRAKEWIKNNPLA